MGAGMSYQAEGALSYDTLELYLSRPGRANVLVSDFYGGATMDAELNVSYTSSEQVACCYTFLKTLPNNII